MNTRPYAAAKRTLSIADKLMEINWGLVLLITIIACGGFAMLYSVAGGRFWPWAMPQIEKFVVGFFILIAAFQLYFTIQDLIRTWISDQFVPVVSAICFTMATVMFENPVR